MATIITRAGKGSALTNAEVDANFSNLNTELGQKLVAADLASYLTTTAAASTYQPLDADLTAIAALTGTSGFLKTNGAGTWSVDTATYLTTASAASTYLPLSGGQLTGAIGIGTAASAGTNIQIGRSITGSANGNSIYNAFSVQSDVTSSATAFQSFPSTAAASFTLGALYHYVANQSTIGAGSAVSSQIGFNATSSLVGATNNYGFYGNIASGTGRWNFYAAGTAANYFGGATTISVNDTTDALRITQTGAGNALLVEDSTNPDSTPFVIDASGKLKNGYLTDWSGLAVPRVGIDANSSSAFATTSFGYNTSAPIFASVVGGGTTFGDNALVASGQNLGRYRWYGTDGAAPILAASIEAYVDGTPGTNDMPGRLVFSTTADGASTPTERMRIDSAGQVGIGGTPAAGRTLTVSKNLTGATTSVGISNIASIQSDVTSGARLYSSYAATAAAAFTLSQLVHYRTEQGTIGAGSSVSNQYGYYVDATLTGATNNYGFFGNIASGTGRWNFYAAGTAANYLAGTVLIGTTTDNGTDKLQVNGSVSATSFSGAGTGLTGTAASLNIGGSAGSVAWTNVSGRPTAVSSFTNDSGYITSADLSGYLTSATAASTYAPVSTTVTLTGTQTLTNKTITDTVYTLATSGSIALNPANGGIQSCAAAGAVTFTDSLSAGQSIVLRIASGSSYTFTWPTTTWVGPGGNAAPTLNAGNVIVLWKEGTTLYGAHVGKYA